MVAITTILCATLLQVIILLCVAEVSTSSSESFTSTQVSSKHSDQLQCAPGFLYNSILDKCECYPDSNVLCNEQKASLDFGSCMTYEEGEGSFLGLCISFRAHGRNVSNRVYLDLPENLTDLNEYMCAPMKRKGMICSECIDDFAPAITSFGYQCSNCTDAWYGVPLFLVLEFVPITIFYLIIITFRFSVTSAPMTSFVLFSQLAAHLFTVFIILTAIIENEYGSGIIYFIKLVTSFYGIWNLDFFRYLVPPFCISPHLKLIHIFSLYYISAFYPLVLIGITWACIELHSRNFKPFIWIWGYMKKTSCCMRRQMDLKSTVIDVFATFFLLLYTKLLYTSFYFLIFIRVERNGSTFRVASGLDPSVDYFSKDHVPFAVIAILILIGPVLLPVILLSCYPIRAFRSLLQKCKVSGHSRAAINLFVEKFYSCYRDGLSGGKDLRSFVFLPFFLRFSIFIGTVLKSNLMFLFLHFLLFGGASLLIAMVQPYKRTYMNIIDSLILAVLSLIGILYILYLYLGPDQAQYSTFFLIALCLDFTLPLFGIIVVFIFKILRGKIPTNWIHICNKHLCRSPCSACTSDEGNNEIPESPNNITTITTTEVELPDRLLHPYRYAQHGLDKASH